MSKIDGKGDPGKSGIDGTGKGGINNKLTEPSLTKEGKPRGNYANHEGGRGNIRQNEAADLFAEQGYDIQMLDEWRIMV
ncbi:hypothetical protein [Paenibacillus guangzhouensis]|uniref:hypothetical protein n=1 Tax=Paenibacillus guangzhouensis TaxID=1473112 RepID=UPI001266BE4B|nr:hypothetical protein [Paenibacillus guangzhouensis]